MAGACAWAQDPVSMLPKGVPAPIHVGVAVFVNDIAKINEAAGTYEANVDIRYRWKDPNLAFDAKEEGGDRQEFAQEAMIAKLSKTWNPQLSLGNQNGSIIKNNGGLFIYADGTVEHIQRMRVVLDNKYKLNAFPFDTQELSFKFITTRFNQNQMEFGQDQNDINASGIRETLTISGWKPKKLDFVVGTNRGWDGQTYPEIEAKMSIQRQPTATLLAVMIPFILTLLVPTLMTLYIKADVAPRMTLWGASILALISLNFTFSVKYPSLGADSIVQQLITIGFGLQLLMVALTATIFNPLVAEKLMGKAMLAETIALVRWAVPVGFICLVVVRAMLTAYS